ncbi:sugar transferase, partial [uncultured Campylobacter sp.]|uniref:sugar transferase n=1 Tax=uncultured Campylobacter sp. TaxID=218934 RepID=UPI00260A6FDD
MKKQLCVLIILAVDIFGIWLCFGLAVVLKNLLYGDSVLLDIGRYQGFAPSYVIMIFLFFYQGIYSRRYDFWHESRILVRSCFFGLLLSLALLALIKVNYEFSRASFILSFAFMAVVLPLFKLVTKRRLFKFGLWQKRAKILGEGEEFESAVLGSAYPGYVRALGRDYDVLFIGGSRLGADALNELIEHNIRKNKEILFTPVLRSYDFTQSDIYSVFASRTSLFAIRNSLKSPLNLALKRGLDLALIILALPLLVPIFGVIALMMKLKEPEGRIFFSHQRMGFGGKPFGCLKFRSMREDGDEILAQYLKQNPQEVEYFEKYHKYEHDPRITKLGDFLRRSSLDELPQLINVLKGEMSIV